MEVPTSTLTPFLQSHRRCQASPGREMGSVVIADLKQLGELEASGCAPEPGSNAEPGAEEKVIKM